MQHIPQAEPVKVNDVVVSSGLGGPSRPVPIGRIVQLETLGRGHVSAGDRGALRGFPEAAQGAGRYRLCPDEV